MNWVDLDIFELTNYTDLVCDFLLANGAEHRNWSYPVFKTKGVMYFIPLVFSRASWTISQVCLWLWGRLVCRNVLLYSASCCHVTIFCQNDYCYSIFDLWLIYYNHWLGIYYYRTLWKFMWPPTDLLRGGGPTCFWFNCEVSVWYKYGTKYA